MLNTRPYSVESHLQLLKPMLSTLKIPPLLILMQAMVALTILTGTQMVTLSVLRIKVAVVHAGPFQQLVLLRAWTSSILVNWFPSLNNNSSTVQVPMATKVAMVDGWTKLSAMSTTMVSLLRLPMAILDKLAHAKDSTPMFGTQATTMFQPTMLIN